MINMSIHGAIIFTLLISSIFIGESWTADSSVCGDWVSYQDEWCYKILDDTFRTFDEAVKSCAKLEGNPTLPIIHTKAEQDFLSNYLFKVAGKIESFWIGAKFSNSSNKFQWIDNTELSFTNWDAKGERGKANYCVQMQGDEASVGKWIDEPCDKKKNLVMCQKMQIWTLARLQKTLLGWFEDAKSVIKTDEEKNQASKKELTDSLANVQNHIKSLEQNLASVKSELETAKSRIQIQEQNAKKQADLSLGQNLASVKSELSNSLEIVKSRIQKLEQNEKALTDSLADSKNHIRNLELNPVPVGFIYVQLPGQPEPLSIWPGLVWSQVTHNYAGQFFRAEGGGSAAFGTEQNGDSPRLTSVESEFVANQDTRNGAFSLNPGQWTGFVRSGGPGGEDEHHGIKFLISNTEVRPRNQAVRIWKREH